MEPRCSQRQLRAREPALPRARGCTGAVPAQYLMQTVSPVAFLLQKADKVPKLPESSQPQVHGISHIGAELLTLLCWTELWRLLIIVKFTDV